MTTAVVSGLVKEIDNATFSGCTRLEKVELPVTLTQIGDDAFGKCASLKSMVLPNAVAELGSSSFSGCSSLSEIELSNSLKTIGRGAFEGCALLTTIRSNAAVPPVCKGDNVFKKVNVGACHLSVPKGSKGLYNAAKIWSQFANVEELILVSTGVDGK
jgi:hypothetical protein